ncbi:hypothetical protein MYSTI_03007 [Myxococcus stipitatus DSM 14675]|uniref:J domain-containing protein n=1 Tax=Myxococcus stipitatus (strain DSM 14675 / JCM 12634 / Mx s8) TaxID=1278073 RepID=L7U886_MYXSD|nr:hypothetical protein [Myxococcus stipitatus]AGC44323.1 hypothetical protein MYSTI_03007 [Myxococcus stipitatus DSM 14675]
MTLEEAWGELGVEAGTAPDLARRAYLRVLKTRKPEVDPQGFARLREAYERVKAALEGTEAPRTHSEPEASTAQPPPPQRPQSADQRLDAFRARFSTLPSDAPLDAPVQIAREAVAALPEAAEARHWLIKSLLAAKQEAEATQAFRDAANQGHPEFLVGLAQVFPHALTGAELQLLGTMVDPPFLWKLADELGTRDAWAQAGQVALLALASLKDHPEDPPPQPTWILGFLLHLHMNGQPVEARTFQRRYADWLKAEGLDEAFEKQDEAWLWTLVLELGTLSDDFPNGVRRLLAHSVINGSIENAREHLRAYRRREPERTAEALEQLRAHCPLFSAAMGERFVGTGTPSLLQRLHIQAPSAEQHPGGEARPVAPATHAAAARKYTWYVILGLIALLMLAVGVEVIGGSTPDRPPPSRLEHATTARAEARVLCEETPDAETKPPCSKLFELISSAESGTCAVVSTNYLRLRIAVEEMTTRSPADIQVATARRLRRNHAQTRLETALRELCPQSL